MRWLYQLCEFHQYYQINVLNGILQIYIANGIETCTCHERRGLTAWGGKPQSLRLYGNFPRRKTLIIKPSRVLLCGALMNRSSSGAKRFIIIILYYDYIVRSLWNFKWVGLKLGKFKKYWGEMGLCQRTDKLCRICIKNIISYSIQTTNNLFAFFYFKNLKQ